MIIFLYGPDTFRSREKLKGLKKRFIAEVDKSGLNLVTLGGDKMKIDDFNKAISTQSFLSSKRMIVVTNIFGSSKVLQNEVLELLRSKDMRDKGDENVIVFFDEKVDKRVALFKYLQGGKFKEEFNVLDGAELVRWIVGRVEEKKGKISNVNANFLASKSDGNLWILAGEIDKLLALKKEQEIERADIEESSLSLVDDNIFNLTDAIASVSKKRALKLVDDNLGTGMNEIYLLTMIVRQFRILICIKAALDGGISNNREIANKLRLHPYVVQKSIPQARNYTMDKLRDIYGKLLEVDLSLKSSDVSGKVILEKLVMDV